jgi:hypothetical protein
VELLGQISPDGAEAAKQLERLLGLKDDSQYGFTNPTGQSSSRQYAAQRHS